MLSLQHSLSALLSSALLTICQVSGSWLYHRLTPSYELGGSLYLPLGVKYSKVLSAYRAPEYCQRQGPESQLLFGWHLSVIARTAGCTHCGHELKKGNSGCYHPEVSFSFQLFTCLSTCFSCWLCFGYFMVKTSVKDLLSFKGSLGNAIYLSYVNWLLPCRALGTYCPLVPDVRGFPARMLGVLLQVFIAAPRGQGCLWAVPACLTQELLWFWCRGL